MLCRSFLLCACLSAVVITAYLAQVKPDKLLEALSRFDPRFLLLGLGTVLLSWVLEGVRVHLIADALEEKVSLWRLIGINLTTMFGGNVVPMASMAVPLQVFLLHREGVPVGKATAIVAVRTAASTLLFTIGAPLLFLIYGRSFVRGLTSNLALSATIQLILVISSVVALITLAILIRPEIGVRLTNAAFSLRFVRRLLGDRSDRVVERVAREAEEFHASMTALFRNRLDAVLVVLLTVLYWVLYFSVAPLLMLGVGYPLTWQGLVRIEVFLFLVYFIISYTPIPAGSGASELSFGSILLFFGVSGPIRTVILVVWSFLCVQIYTLLGGVFFLGSLRKRKRRPPSTPPGGRS